MDKRLQQFEAQSYLNLETFRKNGQGVKTPVWFVQEGTALRVWTFAGAGKIKRIRRDGSVRITPSDASGAPLGEWVPAQASADDSPETVKHVEKLMRMKYGWQFIVFAGLGRLRKSKHVVLRVELGAQP